MRNVAKNILICRKWEATPVICGCLFSWGRLRCDRAWGWSGLAGSVVCGWMAVSAVLGSHGKLVLGGQAVTFAVRGRR